MKEQWKVGEIIELGHYPQSRVGAREPVEWKVLRIDGSKAFVTSVYALDAKPYHASAARAFGQRPGRDPAGTGSIGNLIQPGFQEATWEGSTLRVWLNGVFQKIAFSGAEQACLLETDELGDRVTLLSLDEHINNAAIFPTDASTGCRATPFAAELYTDDIETDRQGQAIKPLPPRASYWLKNRGVVIHGDQMQGVMGVVCMRLDLVSRLAVRPALTVDLDRYERLLSLTGIVHRFEEENKLSVTVKKNGAERLLECDDLDIHITLKDPGEEQMKAIAVNTIRAIGGDKQLQFLVGELCWGTGGLCQNYREAVRWYRYAANQGHTTAMVNLAEAYFYGKGVEKDAQAAFAFTLRAAEGNDPLGMLNAGKCLENGWGTEKNAAEAAKWYARAANAGNREAAARRDALR
ncbi:MAG: sel1 repeat family protein [Clostridia bacterium]|nr:sel1 repeat family protein [Clostridia bacterium]